MDNRVVFYSIIQYVPDPTRNERMNVGVVVTDEVGAVGRAKFVRDWGRARLFGKEDVSFLRDFAHALSQELQAQLPLLSSVTRWDLGHLQKFSLEWRNSIQISEPRASTLNPERLLEDVYEKFVKELPPRRHAFRDKRAAAGLARTAIKRAVEDRYGKPQSASLVKSHVWINGNLDEHEFDVVIQNHIPLVAARGLSFEVPESPELERDVDALAWAIDDIRRTSDKPKLGVIALPPTDKNREYERARKIYEGLKAEFVRVDEVDEWAKITVGQLPATL